MIAFQKARPAVLQPLALRGGWVGGMQPGMVMGPAGWHISMEWTEDEQRTLEEHLARFPPERYDALQRYVKLASMLPRKSVRDVALRCKWTINQQLLKKRKLEQAGKGPMGVVPKKPGGPGVPGRPVMPVPLVRGQHVGRGAGLGLPAWVLLCFAAWWPGWDGLPLLGCPSCRLRTRGFVVCCQGKLRLLSCCEFLALDLELVESDLHLLCIASSGCCLNCTRICFKGHLPSGSVSLAGNVFTAPSMPAMLLGILTLTKARSLLSMGHYL